jgi:hypothetical protein
MVIVIALLLGLVQGQEPAHAAYVSAADLESTMRQSIANNTLDKKVNETPVKGGLIRVWIVHRTSPEARALLHEELTEIYQIIEGSGTLLTGGAIQDRRAVSDPPNLGPTPSYSVTQIGGVSQKVMPKDVVIMPAGVPHRFTQLDGPISYVIYRFEPAPAR